MYCGVFIYKRTDKKLVETVGNNCYLQNGRVREKHIFCEDLEKNL